MGAFQLLGRLSRLTRLARFAAFVLVATQSRAFAQTPALAGSWTASPLSSTWQLGDWGKACGPPPSGGGAPGGAVAIRQNGNELTFTGAGRAFSTGECWEQHPGLQRISHSASARSFQNVCKTNAGDPRQAKLITTISATDSRISFDETGQYQFVIEGQNCTASVRRTRTYTLVRREGPASPATGSAPPEQPKPSPNRARSCDNPGLPERLEVRPSRKLLRPGEAFTFRTAVVDAQGCSVPVTPNWTVLGGGSALVVNSPGSVSASPSAAESEVALEVTLGDRSVRVVVEIVPSERYDALLQARGLDESGESKEAAVLRVASESLGAREVVARDDSPGKKRWFVAIAGGAALLLGALGLLLVRRTHRHPAREADPESPSRPQVAAMPDAKVCPTCREEFPPAAEFCPNDGNRLMPQTTLSTGPGGAVCPVCGRGFNPGTVACPEHHEELVPAAAYAAARAATASGQVTRSICPLCGTQFAGEIRFCGECGGGVVPIN